MAKRKLKLGSLFDGIAGFPLVASWYGIEPVWASEIEAPCNRITQKHFPNMKHLGDITRIHGDEIEPVDIITGGSPCQDLSVAGKQNGIKLKCGNCGTLVDFKDNTICPDCGAELDFTRSGLFMEQMRIIREMREKTNECFPKIVIWENVYGALSSNNGDDFFCVLREFCKLMAEKLPSFRPESWSNAGEILGESGSLAWRLFDAQYWGVPQRRRRIFLVADFGDTSAREILFKSESLRRHLTPGSAPWKRFAAKTERGTGESSGNLKGNGIDRSDISHTAYCNQGNSIDRVDTAGCNGRGWKEDVSFTLTSTDRHGVAYDVWQNWNHEVGLMEDKTCTLSTGGGKPGQGYPCVLTEEQSEISDESCVAAFGYQQGACMSSFPYEENLTPPLLATQKTAVLIENHGNDCRWNEVKTGVCPTLSAAIGTGGNNTPFVVETPTKVVSDEKPITMTCGSFSQWNEDITATLTSRDYKDPQIVVRPKSVVRRLTPLECERLQGFPDNWTASESDSARYKALGNSVALPCVDYIMSGIADVLDP